MKYPSFLKPIAYICIIFVLVALGLLFQEIAIGMTLIIIYGAVALVFKIKSSHTFALMAVALVYVLIAHILKNQQAAFNMVQYAFLLLCIGVMSALLEERRDREDE